jgi:ABC-type Fe3+/spermidine/putrescine transport system ATPase subunit
VLLLDEPLSNLDAKLREEMRVELKAIQRQIGITTVFVTHDQEEALILSDRVVVMNHGQIVQQGPPVEVYERPAHSFVAGFIGQANLFWGEVVAVDTGTTRVRSDAGLELHGRAVHALVPGRRVLAVIKQTRVRVVPAGQPAGPNVFPARVEFVNYLGPTVQYLCSAGDARLAVALPNDAGAPPLRAGDTIVVSWRPEDCLLLTE